MNAIVDLILKTHQETGWKNNAFEYNLYPFDNKSKIIFRHIKFKYYKTIKNNLGYNCKLSAEPMSSFIKTVTEMEVNKDEIYFDFHIKNQNTFKKCIEKSIETFISLKLCDSCLRIYHKDRLDSNGVCLTCHLQNLIEVKKENCCICLDTECIKLVHALPCGHEFHFACLTKLVKKECPLCRNCFRLR